MKKPTKLASRQTAYVLWFEFLKLALKSQKKIVKSALFVSEPFYRPWNMKSAKDFRSWWKDHGYLFEEKYFVRPLRNGEAPLDKEALIVEIPLSQSSTILTQKVKQLILDALEQKGKSEKKKKGKSTATYVLSEQSEPKLYALRETLTVYRDIYLKDPSLKGIRLLEAINLFYSSRKKKASARVPTPFLFDRRNEESVLRASRNARRYIQRAEKILLNVARGKFPGDY